MTTAHTESTTPALSVVEATPGWESTEYGPSITGSGAAKCASSAVAPIVAVAGGLVTVRNGDRKEIAQTVPALTLGDSRSKGTSFLARNAATGDALYLPWPSLTRVAETSRKTPGYPVPAQMHQARPSEPIVIDGKTRKYDSLAGGTSPIAAHPSTPTSWLDGDCDVIIAEGMMKALSILTACLYGYHGREALLLTDAERDALAAPTAEGRRAAVRTVSARLHGLMESVPTGQRVLVLGVVGVGNWHHNSEWNGLDLRDRAVYICLDADVTTNAQVHRQAAGLWSMLEHKRARVALLRPCVDGDPKAGADDMLAATGMSLDALLNTCVETLPAPPAPPARDGDLRVCPEQGITEVYKAAEGHPGRWEEYSTYALRIAETRDRYTATDAEVASATMPKPTSQYQSGIRMGVTWRSSRDGQVREATFDGPISMLSEQGPRFVNAARGLPADLEASSVDHWPPPPEVIRAAKAHRPEDRLDLPTYMQSGYVPCPDGSMAYVMGNSVVGAGGFTDKVGAGVPELDSAAAEFGLHPTTSPTGGIDKDQIRADLTEVLEVYDSVWTDPAKAAVTVASPLRPAVPVETNSVVNHVGARRSGKSYSARAASQFFRSGLGVWAGEHLTGGASDTPLRLEQNVSLHPFWVADDAAPTTDKKASDGTEAKLGDVIRAVHNRAARRRGIGTGYAENPPRAVLMVTMENTMRVSSVLDRCVTLTYGKGELRKPGVERMNAMIADSLAPARVFTAAVQMVLGEVGPETWAEVTEVWRWRRAQEVEWVEKGMIRAGASENEVRRAAEKAGDLLVGLELLAELCAHVGLDPEVYESRIYKWRQALATLVLKQMEASRDLAPGQALLTALRADLAAGLCHIAVPGSGERPSITEGDGALGQALGWHLPAIEADIYRDDETAKKDEKDEAAKKDETGKPTFLRPEAALPRGRTVGCLVREPEGGRRWCVLIYHTAGASVLLRDGGHLPHGTRLPDSLRAARDEGLCSDAWTPNKGQQRVMAGGVSVSGTAILLDALLQRDVADETDTTEPAAQETVTKL
ncbi:hypothetical protein FNH13_17615 [Ornithinimicrobium ciconiae]|uniref:DUF927 domain-containing protein n=1 Tax=Ornithinimicrobium ciconiae TaxID=2594265 RepID=A0A516GEG6_9MICO|nr:hypothetical protein [Ornithinimicrobium ciconiae]QDO89919.1 hypothetical protein FNH13_17615 [Ornithinimicrobium ciconiae]